VPKALEVVAAAHWLEAGVPPVAGGQADQAGIFLAAARFVKAENHRMEEAEMERIRRRR